MRSLLVATVALFLFDGAPIRPGDASLDSSRIRTGVDSLIVLSRQGEQLSLVGTMVFHTQSSEGQITRTEKLIGTSQQPVMADSFALDAQTLAPTYRVVGGQTRSTVGSAFLPNSIDLVLAALPLAEGYESELVLETEGTTLPESARVRVSGVVDVPLPTGSTCRSWEVTVDIGPQRGVYNLDLESRELTRYLALPEGVLLSRIRTCG